MSAPCADPALRAATALAARFASLGATISRRYRLGD